MSELWALTASAGEVDSAARDHLAREMEEWLDAGRDGVALMTCHRAELYGLGAMACHQGHSITARIEPLLHLAREVVARGRVDFACGRSQGPELTHASSSIYGPASARPANRRVP